MATKQTASELYDERREDITRMMNWIELELDKHKTKAEANPKNYGYAGDLGYVRENLVEILTFLSNGEQEDIKKRLRERR